MALIDRPANIPGRLFINGELAEASDGRTYDNINPTDEEVIAPVAMAGVKDLEAAIDAAKAAQAPARPLLSRSGSTFCPRS